jgi:hypothetical protein
MGSSLGPAGRGGSGSWLQPLGVDAAAPAEARLPVVIANRRRWASSPAAMIAHFASGFTAAVARQRQLALKRAAERRRIDKSTLH